MRRIMTVTALSALLIATACAHDRGRHKGEESPTWPSGSLEAPPVEPRPVVLKGRGELAGADGEVLLLAAAQPEAEAQPGAGQRLGAAVDKGLEKAGRAIASGADRANRAMTDFFVSMTEEEEEQGPGRDEEEEATDEKGLAVEIVEGVDEGLTRGGTAVRKGAEGANRSVTDFFKRLTEDGKPQGGTSDETSDEEDAATSK